MSNRPAMDDLTPDGGGGSSENSSGDDSENDSDDGDLRAEVPAPAAAASAKPRVPGLSLGLSAPQPDSSTMRAENGEPEVKRGGPEDAADSGTAGSNSVAPAASGKPKFSVAPLMLGDLSPVLEDQTLSEGARPLSTTRSASEGEGATPLEERRGMPPKFASQGVRQPSTPTEKHLRDRRVASQLSLDSKRKSKSREDMTLSLDLSSVQASGSGGEAASGLEPSYTRQKREKVAYYGSCCSEIRPWLYLGGNSVAANKEQLVENGITDVLNFSAVIHPNYHENDPDSKMRYHPYFLMDSQMEPISSLFYDVIDLIDAVKARKGKAFVHCHQGVSRSATACIAYLMATEDLDYHSAYVDVRKRRDIINPNPGFTCHLLQFGMRLRAKRIVRTRRGSATESTGTPVMQPQSPLQNMFRLYVMEPHEQRRPDLIVPKTDGRKRSELTSAAERARVGEDKSACLLLHSASSLCIYAGPECPEAFRRSARRNLLRIARWEKSPQLDGQQDLEIPIWKLPLESVSIISDLDEFWTALTGEADLVASIIAMEGSPKADPNSPASPAALEDESRWQVAQVRAEGTGRVQAKSAELDKANSRNRELAALVKAMEQQMAQSGVELPASVAAAAAAIPDPSIEAAKAAAAATAAAKAAAEAETASKSSSGTGTTLVLVLSALAAGYVAAGYVNRQR